ncbi:sugar porter family MFS transporter [Legionella sp. W05-934-2]|uniref:sugar porter family MFS transporter n=1 Tax=Legionella sp. W05-934-2 TaxID=1198649 RepID=UPI0034619D3E
MVHQKAIYLISSVAALAGLLFGFDTGVISGAILFINNDFQLSHVQTEVVVSAVLFGAFFSALMSGRLCDIHGRKKVIILTALTFIVGTLVCAFTPNVNGLVLGRLILGLAIGIASYAAPLYLAEISPKKTRGFIVTLNQLAITVGILFSYLVDYAFSYQEAWRVMLFVGIVPALLLFVGMMYLPESPRYLLLKKKVEEARQLLAKIRPANEVEDELSAIIHSQEAKSIRGRDLWMNKRFRAILLVGITLAISQQVTGINTIIYYAPTIFQRAGFHTTNAILVTTMIGIVNVVSTLIALPLIDRIGRKTLLLVGVSGMCISLVMMGYAFTQHVLNDSLRYLLITSMMAYIACFAFSLGPMVFVILSEIFPLAIRGRGMSLAMSGNWGANTLVALSFLSIIHQIGMTQTFYLFALMCVLTLCFIFYFIPETKGISLEQIERNIVDGVASRHLGQPGEAHVVE